MRNTGRISEADLLEQKIQELKEKQKKAKLEERQRSKHFQRIAHEAIGECFHSLFQSEDPSLRKEAHFFWSNVLQSVAQEKYSKMSKKAKTRADALLEIFDFQVEPEKQSNVENIPRAKE